MKKRIGSLEIPKEVILVAISKKKTVDDIKQAIKAGVKNIGESSLYKWSKEIEESPLSIEENNFISMQVDVTDTSITNNKNFFLNLPNNVILEFPCGFDVHYLNKLITKLLK